MSDRIRDLTLERLHRMTAAMTEMSESHASQGRLFLSMMQRITEHLERLEASQVRIERQLGELGSEVVLSANRVENAFARSLKLENRMNEMEERLPS